MEKIISSANIEEFKKNKLKSLFPTRWVERHDSLIVFKELIYYIFELLEELESHRDEEVASKVVAFGTALKRNYFIICLCTYSLSLTLKLRNFLHNTTQDPTSFD